MLMFVYLEEVSPVCSVCSHGTQIQHHTAHQGTDSAGPPRQRALGCHSVCLHRVGGTAWHDRAAIERFSVNTSRLLSFITYANDVYSAAAKFLQDLRRQ